MALTVDTAGNINPKKPRRITPATIKGRGDVRMAYDDDPKKYGFHYSPEENFDPIKEKGFDPGLKKGHSKGVHFMDNPDSYRPIGDRKMNLYRVLRETMGPTQNVSTDDFYTERAIAPRDIEVYEAPRDPFSPGSWNKLGMMGSGLTLSNLMAEIVGAPVRLQGPTDWAMNELFRTAPQNPYTSPAYQTVSA